MFALPLTLPDGSLGGAFDAPAIDSVEIGQDETAAFRDRIKTCASLPDTISPGDKIRIVLRVAFMPDGTLASEPMLIEGSPSAKGLALKQSAVQALRQCQPYAMLPADKYKEWKSSTSASRRATWRRDDLHPAPWSRNACGVRRAPKVPRLIGMPLAERRPPPIGALPPIDL